MRFEDETMEQVMCNELKYWGKDRTKGKITYGDLSNIIEFDTSYIGYYDTMMDLKKCTELRSLHINYVSSKRKSTYFIAQGEITSKVTKAEVEQVQEELADILPKLTKLNWLTMTSYGDVEWTTIEFIRGCDSIERFWIDNCKATDYSALKTCTSLKSIKIEYSEISKAEDIIGLEHIEFITVDHTPLAENPEEIKKLEKAYPNAEIVY